MADRTDPDTATPSEPANSNLHLHGWREPTIVGVALLAAAAGFGQFGAVAALGDVAKHFGHITHGATIAEQAGLSGTKLGIGLAVLRLASLGGLPLAGLADRFGRRRMMLVTCSLGLALTAVSAVSPTYWWFVAIFALGRPLLSATSGVAQVSAAEQTSSSQRARAVALIAAGYGIGSGVIAIVHSLGSSTLGFRGVVLLALLPLAALPFISRSIIEPDRFKIAAAAREHPLPVLGAVGTLYRRRLLVVAVLTFALSVVTGPANSFFFLYAQNVLHFSGSMTALLVASAGITGLAGLVMGRFLADRFGRRLAACGAMIAMALCGMLTYSGSGPAAAVGYLLAILAASTFAAPAGALTNELFPTSVRASVIGWEIAAGVFGATVGLLAFGAVADVGNRFGLAAVVVFAATIPATALFALLPETRGKEPEDLWPEAS
ncbi:MAG: MFS transporter [Acidimicrobiales bacterium]|jgi:MFS family permease